MGSAWRALNIFFPAVVDKIISGVLSGRHYKIRTTGTCTTWMGVFLVVRISSQTAAVFAETPGSLDRDEFSIYCHRGVGVLRAGRHAYAG